MLFIVIPKKKKLLKNRLKIKYTLLLWKKEKYLLNSKLQTIHKDGIHSSINEVYCKTSYNLWPYYILQ